MRIHSKSALTPRLLLAAAVLVASTGGPARAKDCTMIGNVLRCDDGRSATMIGNVWHWSDGRRATTVGNVTLFRDGPATVGAAFERRADARCGRIGPMEFCAQPTESSQK
jgi:hypothetical protein